MKGKTIKVLKNFVLGSRFDTHPDLKRFYVDRERGRIVATDSIQLISLVDHEGDIADGLYEITDTLKGVKLTDEITQGMLGDPEDGRHFPRIEGLTGDRYDGPPLVTLNAKRLKAICDAFLTASGDKEVCIKIYVDKKNPALKPVVFKDGADDANPDTATALLMPIRPRAL